MNGLVTRQLETRAIWGKDSIKVDGQEVPGPFERIYLMLNKPFGYISSLKDPAGRPVVLDLLKDVKQRVYPVGRLDFDSLGLLLLTNDGDWAYRLTHPRYHVPRTYKVTLNGLISDQDLNSLKKGIPLEDGPSGPSKVSIVRKTQGRSVIRLTIAMGRSRVVRRMIEAVGQRVIHLERIGFGPLELGTLKIGNYRLLEDREIRATKKMVGLV